MNKKENIIKLERLNKEIDELIKKSEIERNIFLDNLAEILIKNKINIILANKKDIKKARENNLSDIFIQRLILDESGLDKIIDKLNDIQKLKSGLGEIIEERVTKEKLHLQKIRVPLGVVAIIYEARPEVTIDVAALCIKSGNAAILKGGSEALCTNKILYQCVLDSLIKSNFPKESIGFISTSNRKIISNILKHNESIDLVIARGSYEMVKAIQSQSTIPVLAHSAGGSRIYVDKSANLIKAINILVNAKVNKPSACNSLDTIILHKKIASKFIPHITNSLEKYGVKIIKNDWSREFLDLKVSIKIVNGVDEAIKFINKYSKQHSEGIIATDKKVIEEFTNSVDSAALFINCSPRLHDGYVFGLGSEMGIATGRLHARGPVGLRELTIYKWRVYGNGQIRQ